MRIIISLFCSFVLLNTGSSFFVDETNSMFMINNQYVISSPLDLKGKTFSVPIGMSIVFKKSGRIENGTIIGNGNTIINPHFDNVSFAGYFLNKDIHISEEAFGDNPDFWGIVSSFSDAVITLDMDVRPAHAPYDDFKLTSFRIQGNRHTIYVNDFPILRNATVSLENIVFVCTGATERVIYAIGPEKEFVIRNCTFINLPEVRFPLCARRFINTVIENCTFQGLLNSTSTRKSVFGFCILLYEVVGKVIVRNNTIQNCFGSGIEGIGFSKESNSEILIEGNIINSVTNGGIVFAGGDVWNVVVRGNLISNTHCLGTIEGEENNKGPNSAINFHGFHNVLIEKNTILDCQNSSCFAFNGQSSDGLNKGYGLTVRNNTCRRTGDVALFHVEKVHIEKNQFNFKGFIAIYGMRARSFLYLWFK